MSVLARTVKKPLQESRVHLHHAFSILLPQCNEIELARDTCCPQLLSATRVSGTSVQAEVGGETIRTVGSDEGAESKSCRMRRGGGSAPCDGCEIRGAPQDKATNRVA